MSALADTRHSAASLDRAFVGRAIVLVLALGQIVSNVVFVLFSPTDLQSGAQFSPLVPPAPMFAVWGVIIAASILWAILQVRPSVRDSALRDRLVLPLSAVYAGFALWLAAASLGQESPWTLVVFVLIVGAHAVAWYRISGARDELRSWRPLDRWILLISQGLYAGWTSIAFFVNIATVAQGSGAPVEGGWGITWQLLLIAAAAGVAVVFVVLSRGSVSYALTASYALVGAGISSSLAGFPVLALALGVGVVLVTATTLVVRIARRPATG